VAHGLLKINADMASLLKTISRTILPAAIGALMMSGIGEAQQLDLSAASAAAASAAPDPAVSAAPAVQPLAQRELNLAAGACGPAGFHEQKKVSFEDEHHNAWYRATARGLNLTGERGLRVIGALLPRWNLAAQMSSEGGTAPGNTFNSMAWSTPNPELGVTPWTTPRTRLVWVPVLTVPCPAP
jgi:hypothetical protein